MSKPKAQHKQKRQMPQTDDNTKPPAKSDDNTKPPDKLSLGHFEVGEMLGQGTFSIVKSAKRWKDGKQYAIKVVEKARVNRNEMFRYVLMEKKVMNMLDHPNIIKLYWTFKDYMCVYLVMELGEGGELWQLLQDIPEKKLPLDLAKFYTAQLVLILEYLTSKNIMHRDVKPENILISAAGHLKLTDFGTAKIIDFEERGKAIEEWQKKRQLRIEAGKDPDDDDSDDDDNNNGPNPPIPYRPSQKAIDRKNKRNSFVGTAEYMSPEILHNHPTKGPSSDLWALGCCLFQFLAGRVPFKGGSSYLTFKKAIALDFEFPSVFDEVAMDLIKKLVQIKPSDRLGSPEKGGFSSLKAHPFFTDIDWEALNQQELKPPMLDVLLAKIEDKKKIEEKIETIVTASKTSVSERAEKKTTETATKIDIPISNLNVADPDKEAWRKLI